jgi:ERCC4-type nuclease
MSATLIIDTRERDLIKQTKIPFKTQSLSVGDIWISCQIPSTSSTSSPSTSQIETDVSNSTIASTSTTIELIIERKTHADLVASLKDGRWREQKSRLLTYCNEEGPHQRHPIYIIEGSMQFLPATGQGMSVSVLRKLMNRLQIKYGINVITTDDLADTALAINFLVEQMNEDPSADSHAFTASNKTKQYYEGVQVTRKANKEDPSNFARAVLMQCPGVSANIADAIITRAGPKLADVFARDEKFLASINVTEKRKVGPAIAKRLLALWNPSI